MAGIDNTAYQGDNSESIAETPALLDLSDERQVKINKAGKVKVPRRVLHCSDGIYEEYSTDEEDEEEPQPIIDPKTLKWGAYVWYLTTKTAFGGLAACDYLGEKLAWFFGITSPRYQYAIDEVIRMKAEEEEQEEQEREEREAELKIVQSDQASKNPNYGTATSSSSALDVKNVVVEEKKIEHLHGDS